MFRGRQVSVTDLVRHIDNGATAHIAILGAGGIGKTSVALAVLHDPKTITRFGVRRYFVSCEGMRHADAVALTLARIVGSKRNAAERDPLAAIRDILDEPTVLVIDNLESIWITDEVKVRRDTERLLQTLGRMVNLSLIVTSRGTILPPGVRWANQQNPSLDTLTVEAALAVFVDIAGDTTLKYIDESRAMERLVKEVNCMPLAVSLLAQLARNGESPRSLLRQWESQRIRLLQTESNGREYNVEASISISLDFLPSVEVNPEPIRLLAICSALPAGLFPDAIKSLQALFNDVDATTRLLLKHALVQRGSNGELKMLSPVRHFVKTRHTVTDVHSAALIEFYCKLARKANQPIDKEFTAVLRLVMPELENLACILHAAIDTTAAPTSTVIEGIIDYSWYTYHTIPTTVLLKALIVRLRTVSGRQRELGRSLRLCGGICRLQHLHSEAEQHLVDAAAIFSGLKDLWEYAECSICLGLVYIQRRQYDMAEDAFKVAMNGFVSSFDELGIAQCRKSMADLAIATGNEEGALKLLESAAEGFRTAGHARGVAVCDKNSGIVSLIMGDLQSAREKLNTARMALEAMGDIHSLAQCNEAIAEVHVAEGTFGQATAALERARALLATTGESTRFEIIGKTVDVISECVSFPGLTWERIRASIWYRQPPKWYCRRPSAQNMSTDIQTLHRVDYDFTRRSSQMLLSEYDRSSQMLLSGYGRCSQMLLPDNHRSSQMLLPNYGKRDVSRARRNWDHFDIDGSNSINTTSATEHGPWPWIEPGTRVSRNTALPIPTPDEEQSRYSAPVITVSCEPDE